MATGYGWRPPGWLPPQQQQQMFASPVPTGATNNYPMAVTNNSGSHNDSIADDDALVDAIERILSAEENRRRLADSPSACMQTTTIHLPSPHVGPFSDKELKILSLLCTQVSNRREEAKAQAANGNRVAPVEGFVAVETDVLGTLTELLEKHVNLAVNVDLIHEATTIIHKREMKMDEWLRAGDTGHERVAALRLGLEAASILLFIATSPDIDPGVVSEDAVEACFTLLRHNLSKNLVPALNNTGHRLAVQEMEDKAGVSSGRKRMRRSTDGGESNLLVRELKKVYKFIATMIPPQVMLMARIEAAIRVMFLDDQLILTLTSGALDALEIEAAHSAQNPANRLQHATIDLITTVFKKFPAHRSTIMEDLFPLMLRLPTSKRTMRACLVQYSSCPSKDSTQTLISSLYSTTLTNGPEPHYIQMITALLLSLVQCCVVRPTFGGTTNEEADNSNIQVLVSGLRGCQAVADIFASHMLQRCSRKGEDGGASEFRPILGNLVEDLLLVMMIPEYSAAQLVLFSCTHGLSRDIIMASRATSSSASDAVVETTYANTAFDMLGRICAAYAKILRFQRDRDLHTRVTVVPEDERHLRCYCNRNSFRDTLMVDCDNCHVWYHAQCVGLSRDALPPDWTCDACSLQANMVHEKETTSRHVVDTNFIIHRVMEKHLKSTRGFQVVAQCHVAKWLNELHGKAIQCKSPAIKASYNQAIAAILETWDSPCGSSTPRMGFTQEGGARALLTLTTSYSSFTKSFNALMGLMLKLMSDKAHASLRKLSIRAIEKVVEADSKLMLLSKVMNAVSERLSDESISVREAVVSLVGNYVVASPSIADAFHVHLIPRLLDPGVSVRKRTVKILQDILCKNPSYRGRSDACDKCLQRAADPKEDDGVREALHTLFMKLWLEEGEDVIPAGLKSSTPARNGLPLSPASVEGHSIEGVVTPTPPMTDGRATRSMHREIGKLRSELAAEQMVATVKTAGTNEHLGNFLRELLCNVNDSDKGKKAAERLSRQKIAEKHVFSLVDALFELLLSTEERRDELGNALGEELVATIRTIGCFAEVSAKAVLQHLATVLPYLKADNGLGMAGESALASAAADILFRVTPILNESDVQKLSAGSLGGDLVKITYKFGSGALFSAVRALCTVAHHEEAGEESVFGKKLMGLATTCYAYLLKQESCDNFSSENMKNNTLRLLSALGALCRHHEVQVELSTWNEEVEENEIEMLETADLNWGNLPIASFRLFIKYMDKAEVGIKCAALRALGAVFVQHPRLMLACAQSGLVDSVMASDSPLEVQLTALACWKDISVSEEKRIDSGEAKKKMDQKKSITTTKKISGDQDGDSTLVGSVLAKQAYRVFEMTQSKEPALRVASLELLAQLLRQGLVNPNDAVPYLLALQGDVENLVVRKHALTLLIAEGEKRPDMLRQRVCAGIKQACQFQRQVYPLKETSALVKKGVGSRVEVETVFDNVFRECILSSRKQREGLYRNLVAMFERVEPTEKENEPSSAKKKSRSRRSSGLEAPSSGSDSALLSFAAQVLAYLPYTSAGDPLFLQYHITSIVALQGPQLLDRLAAFLRDYGLASSDELDEVNADEDALERAAQTNAPSKSDDADPTSAANFDWHAFAVLCKEASCLALLLRMKNFLRKKYNLTTAKCLEYSPDSKDKSFFRNFISRTTDTITAFDSSIVVLRRDNSIDDGDKDIFIQHYASFRRLMRKETSPEEAEVDSDDEDTAKPHGRGSVGGEIDLLALSDEGVVGETEVETNGDAAVEDETGDAGVQKKTPKKKKRRSSTTRSANKKRRASRSKA